MCGIAGYVSQNLNQSLLPATLAMVKAIARRGPDSEGIEQWPGAVLGHRRLAILDLSDAGRQPMLSDDGEVGIVFNGCIYNFLDLRKELQSYGHRFRSDCDTEVLVRGYEQWGIDALVSRLRGMFAFGVWDNRVRKLTLVRDRLGVKPLVYAAREGRIAFASTVTALRDADLVSDIDPEAMLEFLEFGWVSDDRAIFTGAQKVPAGCIVEWQGGRLTERSYWTLPEAGTRVIRFEDAVEEAESLLVESVRLRLISDVPVGSLLSGGIDSALICWATAKAGADIKAFTVSTPGDPADESAGARETARQIGIPHEVIELPPNAQPELDDLTCAYGEPFACSSALGMLRVCKAVKPKVTVLLTGDGGDDVFLGYPHHRDFWMAQRLSRFLPQPMAKFWPKLEPVASSSTVMRRAWRLVDYATGGLGAVTQAHNGLPYYQRAGLLGDRFRDLRLKHREIPRSFQSGRQLLSQFLDYERRTRFVSEYMTKVDGGAMFYAIEARSPLLDQKLWEFGASLPFDVRLHGSELKAVLRAVARKNIGNAVASRRKQGFTIPVSRWLTTAWKQQLESVLDGSYLEREGWIRPGMLRRAVEGAATSGSVPLQLWYLVVLEKWAQNRVSAPAFEPIVV